jgi:hypothetical protein
MIILFIFISSYSIGGYFIGGYFRLNYHRFLLDIDETILSMAIGGTILL